MPAALNPKQRAFVEAYSDGGDGVLAARAAGYAGDDAALARRAAQLLAHEGVRSAVRARWPETPAAEAVGPVGPPGPPVPHGLTAEELRDSPEARRLWWARIVCDDGQAVDVRLKASDYLAKASGDYSSRLHVSGQVTLESLVLAAAQPVEAE